MVAWRREKFVAFGGPSGGDGGRGGSVILVADENLNTLMDLRYQKHIRAPKGKGGENSRKQGRSGEDRVVRVPVGTQVFDRDTDAQIGDLVEHEQRLVVAQGGEGGRGNARFVTSTNRAPEHAQPGTAGEARNLRLELKLLADVGIIGYPSVGKSTLISAISNAQPRIASYPFTTLVPNLGVVEWRDGVRLVVADIPGLIEGASEGHGLGHQFLRHIERCRLLVHMIEVPPPFDYGDGVDWTDRSPLDDFARLNRELELWDPELARREQIVVLNKADLPHVQEEAEALREHFEGEGQTFLTLSAARRLGLQELLDELGRRVVAFREEQARARAEAREAHQPLLDDDDPELTRAVERGDGASGQGRNPG